MFIGLDYKPGGPQKIKLIDSDFEEYIMPLDFGLIKLTDATIDEYEKRNLPIGQNILRFMLWYAKELGLLSIKDLVFLNRKYSIKFAKYANDIEKYLILM
jgi:hypothetical protein